MVLTRLSRTVMDSSGGHDLTAEVLQSRSLTELQWCMMMPFIPGSFTKLVLKKVGGRVRLIIAVVDPGSKTSLPLGCFPKSTKLVLR